MKIVAYYLPQFHEIPENNEWWGDGFTEWTNTKKSAPLYVNHFQPRVPYEENYYNLRDVQAIKWQINIAKRYGVDAFCFYHYWFRGRKLLHEPIESYRKLSSNKLDYCLSWANESWTRSWDGKNRKVLIKQEYGNKNDWKNHFDYLSQFFHDENYLKIDGNPVMVIHRAGSIGNYLPMIESWRDFAREEGFKGMHIVQTLNGFDRHPLFGFDAIIEYEPMYTIKYYIPIYRKIFRYSKAILNKLFLKAGISNYHFFDIFDYDYIWKKILSRSAKDALLSVYPGAFVDWDNSSRRGFNATIFKGASPNKFYSYMRKRISTAVEAGYSDLLFINAWNEWAEGTYLEPDQRYGFAYLEALNAAKNRDL